MKKNRFVKLAFYVMLFSMIILAGCKTNDDAPGPGDPSIEYFKADPSDIVIGAKSTLSWSALNVDRVMIDNGIGEKSAKGSIDVYPANTTIYKLTAGSASAPATVNVSQGPQPSRAEIVYFHADDYDISAYQDVLISWAVVKATTAKINGAYVNFSGSYSRKFAGSESLILEAVGADGVWVSASITINVDLRSACQWFGAGSYGWSYPSAYICKVTTNANGSPYYAAKNLTFMITLYDHANNVIDSGTGVIPIILPGATGEVLINLPNGQGGKADHVQMVLSRCDCDFTKP